MSVWFVVSESISASPREFIVDVILSPIQKPTTPAEEVIRVFVCF